MSRLWRSTTKLRRHWYQRERPLPVPRPARRLEHELTHLPFRSWCEFCVKGRAKSNAHLRNRDKESQKVPTISIDYMYMEEKDKESQRGMPILIVKDRKSKTIKAEVVPEKGVNEFAVKW